MHYLDIYVDGSCNPNDNKVGGVCAVFSADNGTKNIIFSRKINRQTTTAECEVEALSLALEKLIRLSVINKNVRIFTDNQYVFGSYALNWIENWKLQGFISSKHPENWKRIDEMYNFLREKGVKVVLKKVKGHSGVELNELADKYANKARKR